MIDYLSMALGVLLAVAAFAVLRVRRMMRISLEAIANAPFPPLGDHSKITVWGFADEPMGNLLGACESV